MGQPSQPPPSPTPQGSGPAEAPFGFGDTVGGARWGSAPFLPPNLLLSPGGAACASGAAVSASSRTDVGRMPEDEAIVGPEVDPRVCAVALSPVRDENLPLRVRT